VELPFLLCWSCRARDVSPDLEALRHLVAVLLGREEVAPQSAVRRDGPLGGEEPLCMPWGFKPLHPPLPLGIRCAPLMSTCSRS
jgi:hypothetical protein